MKTNKLLLLLAMLSLTTTSWAGLPVVGCDSVVTTKDNIYTYKAIYEKNDLCDLLVTDYMWDPTQNVWVINSKNEYNFDAQGNLTLYAYYDRTDDAWVGFWKDEYEYNEQGDIIKYASSSWENEDWAIQFKYKYNYEYMTDSTVASISHWDEESDWKDNGRHTIKRYDANGKLIESSAHWRWDSYYKGWIPPYNKTEYEYNTQGKLIREISYGVLYKTKVSEIYDIEYYYSNKYEYEYDDDGNQASYTTYKWNSSVWELDSKFVHKYDSQGNMNYEEYYDDKEILVGYVLSEPVYGILKNLLYSVTNYGYDGQNRVKMERSTQIEYKLTSNYYVLDNKSILIGGEYAINNDASSVINTTYYYSGETSGITPAEKKNQVSIHSNPATSIITASGLQGNKMLKFYNINGNLLLSHQAAGETENITVNHLPAGVYIIKISDGQTLKWIKK